MTVCGGAIFCVAVFSLYLMLDRVQHDPARRQNGGNFPRVSENMTESPFSCVIHEHKDFSKAQLLMLLFVMLAESEDFSLKTRF